MLQPPNQLSNAFMSFADLWRTTKHLQHPKHASAHTPSWQCARWWSALFHLSHCKQAPSSQSIWCHFFFVFFLACLCFLLVILLFRMTPPGAVLKRYLLSLIAHKKVMMRLPEEIHIRQVTTVKQGNNTSLARLNTHNPQIWNYRIWKIFICLKL